MFTFLLVLWKQLSSLLLKDHQINDKKTKMYKYKFSPKISRITSIMSKMFEILILNLHRRIMETTSNQFGFKPKHGKDQSVFVLKQVIAFYKSSGSPLYLCYLDLSNEFDHVDHSLLFRKLLRRKLPAIIVRMLQNWYCTVFQNSVGKGII